MSFIYNDKKLIKELLKIGLGPVAPAMAPAMTKVTETAALNTQTFEMAKKLVGNLLDQLSSDNNFSAEREDAKLFPRDLVNLNKLVHFLSINGIEYNSMLISLDVAESLGGKSGQAYYAALQDSQKALYAQYLTDNSGKPLYYVYKEGLIAYLKDLQSKNNAILNPMLEKIIEEANQALQLNIPKEQPKKDEPAPGKDVPGQPSGKQAPQAQPSLSSQSLSDLIKDLPFRIDDIDFNRIDNFFNSYKGMLSSQSSMGRSIPIPQAINNAIQSMGHVNNNSNSYIRVFNLRNLTIPAVKLWAKVPQGQHLHSLLDALTKVIYNTSLVVLDLKNTYFNQISKEDRQVQENNYEAYKDLVDQQLAIYQSNFSKLREVIEKLESNAR